MEEKGIKKTVLIKPVGGSAHGIFILRDFSKIKEFIETVLVALI